MLIFGVALTAAALLTLVALIPVYNGPRPPRWTRSRALGELITLCIVAAIAIGIASFCAGAAQAWQAGPSGLEIGAGVLLLAAIVVLWRWLGQRRRAIMQAAPAPLAATPPLPREPQPPRPARRAA